MEGTDWSHGRKEPRAEGCRRLWGLEKAGDRAFLGASRKNWPCSRFAFSPRTGPAHTLPLAQRNWFQTYFRLPKS